MIKSGLAMHVHHGDLFEFCHNLDERVRFIKENKPKVEKALRLRLFQLVPEDSIPGKNSPEWKAYREAGEAFREAEGDYWEAEEAYWEAEGDYWKAEEVREAREAFWKANGAYWEADEAFWKAEGDYWEADEAFWKALREAGRAYKKAGRAYFTKYQKELSELHAELCPDCPWDGKTIFTRKDKQGNWY